MSGSKVSNTYAVREGSLREDADTILRLWSFFPGDKPPQREKLDWFYNSNPAGPGVVFFLVYLPEDRPVGVVCLGRRNIVVGGQNCSACVFADFAIEPTHRSLGPALLFQRDFLRLARERFDIVYGFPNDLSGRVRVFGGFKLDAELAFHVMPLDFRHYFGRHLPLALATPAGTLANLVMRLGLKIKTYRVRRQFHKVSADREFMDSLWSRLGRRQDGLGVRDADYLQWRLGDSPYRRFTFVALADENGDAAGWAAISQQRGGTIDVIDHLAINDDALLSLLSTVALDGNRDVISVTMTMDPSRQSVVKLAKSLGFHERHRYPYFVSLGESAPKIDKTDIRLNICDNDA